MRLRKELDFEKQQFFNLTLTAEDRGVPSLISQTFVEMEVRIILSVPLNYNVMSLKTTTNK